MGSGASRSSICEGSRIRWTSPAGWMFSKCSHERAPRRDRRRDAPELLLASRRVSSRKRSADAQSIVGAAHRRGRTQAVFYRDEKGGEPVDAFLEELLKTQPLAAAKIDDAIEEHLNGRNPDAPPPEFPITSQIDGELRELRVRFARTGYRLLYQRSGNLMVLLHAFEKNTGAVPASDQGRAKRRMADFEARMNAARRRRPRAAGGDAPLKSRP
jgi:phage-related protein